MIQEFVNIYMPIFILDKSMILTYCFLIELQKQEASKYQIYFRDFIGKNRKIYDQKT